MNGKSKAAGSARQNGGWTIAPLLAPRDYYSQAHKSKVNGVNAIPLEIAFSGPLSKFGAGGAHDIYDEEKVMEDWKGMSQVEREVRVHWMATKQAVDYMLQRKGFRGKGSQSALNFLGYEYSRMMTVLHKADSYDQAKAMLDQLLESGIPVTAGVSYQSEKKPYRLSGQNHFVLIVGRGEDNQGKFYSYFDPGRTAKGHDTQNNRLYLGQTPDGAAHPFHISGKRGDGRGRYFLCEIRQMARL